MYFLRERPASMHRTLSVRSAAAWTYLPGDGDDTGSYSVCDSDGLDEYGSGAFIWNRCPGSH